MLAAMAAASLMLTACGGKESYSPEAGTAPAKMFEQACAHCHGSEGSGKFGFLLSLQGSQTPKDVMADIIRNGNGIMPAFPELSDKQIQKLATYTSEL
jgi:mono/diheme cytochrome c family protein